MTTKKRAGADFGSDYKSGVVGIVGLPNAGKSTLVNALIGEKVSIVTSKPQTTRQRITGICNTKKLQAVLVDAPGFVNAQVGLNGFLNQEAASVVDEVEALVFVISLGVDEFQKLEPHLKALANVNKPLMVLFNKEDQAKAGVEEKYLALVAELGFSVMKGSLKSPKKSSGVVSVLTSWFEEILPETGAPLYDTEVYTTQTLRELSEEIIREQAFRKFQQEIPFGLGVRVLKFDESNQGLVKIYAEIWVNRESHKAIVVGKRGANLKEVGSQARMQIEELVGSQVFLDLHVKAKKNWVKNDQLLQEMGYVQSS